REGALRAQVASIADDLGAGAEVAEDDRFWRGFNGRWTPVADEIRLVVGSRPHCVPDLARIVAAWPGVTALALSGPTGSIRVSLDPAALAVDELRARLAELNAAGDVSWVLESAPAGWRGAMPAWSDPGPSHAVMRSIKQQFDPAGI